MDPQNTQNPLGNPMISTPQGGGITGNPQAFPQSDIIISPVSAKKSKKPLVIILIILILLAAGILLVNNQTQLSIKQTYDNYSEAISSDEIDQTILKDIVLWSKELQNNPQKLTQEFNLDQDTSKSAVAGLYDYTSVYAVTNQITESNEIFTYYINHQTFDGVFSDLGYPFRETDDGYLFNIEATINQYLLMKAELYDSYNKNGCFENSEFNTEKCQEDSEKELKLKSFETVIGGYMETLLGTMRASVKKIESGRNE